MWLWFSLQVFFATFLVLRRIKRDIVINVTSSCKVPVILTGFYSNFNFLHRLSKKLKCQVSSKSVQLEPSYSIRTDRRTDGWTCDEANSCFSQCCERAWKQQPVFQFERNFFLSKYTLTSSERVCVCVCCACLSVCLSRQTFLTPGRLLGGYFHFLKLTHVRKELFA